MNKKKIILSVLIMIFAGIVFYFMNISKPDKTEITSGPGEIKPAFTPPPNMPPLSVTTDRATYGSREKVMISVQAAGSKNIPAFRLCAISIKRTESRTGKETSPAGLAEKYVLNESSKECKEYKAGFIFELDDSNVKSLEWDQRSCENGNVPAQAIPDDYSVMVSCSVQETERYSGPKTFSDAANIRIGEDASCNDKKIGITKSAYDRNGTLSVGIENTGTEDIKNVRLYLDKCENDSKAKFEKDLGPLSFGHAITKTIKSEEKCNFSLINAHINECYDRTPERWANSNITKP